MDLKIKMLLYRQIGNTGSMLSKSPTFLHSDSEYLRLFPKITKVH